MVSRFDELRVKAADPLRHIGRTPLLRHRDRVEVGQAAPKVAASQMTCDLRPDVAATNPGKVVRHGVGRPVLLKAASLADDPDVGAHLGKVGKVLGHMLHASPRQWKSWLRIATIEVERVDVAIGDALFRPAPYLAGERRGHVLGQAQRLDPQRGSAMAWLTTLARNRSVDHYRRAACLTREPPETLETIIDPQPNAEAALIVGETHALIHSSLNSIEPRAQRLIRAAFFGDATYAELAKQEGVPLSTMKSTIRRALAKIRDGVAAA